MSNTDPLGGITPYLTLGDGQAAANFYRNVFGAEETFVRKTDDGHIAHMTLSLNEGVLMLADTPGWGRWPKVDGPVNAAGWLAIKTADCDATFDAAIAAGAIADLEPENTAWGDRYARFRDPFGQLWAISGPARSDA